MACLYFPTLVLEFGYDHAIYFVALYFGFLNFRIKFGENSNMGVRLNLIGLSEIELGNTFKGCQELYYVIRFKNRTIIHLESTDSNTKNHAHDMKSMLSFH